MDICYSPKKIRKMSTSTSSNMSQRDGGVDAAVLGNEPNVGVTSTRFRNQYRNSVSVVAKGNPEHDGETRVSKEPHLVDDLEEIARKYETWKLAHDKQQEPNKRTIGILDVAKIILMSLVAKRIINRIGIPMKKIAGPLCVFLVFRGLYLVKASPKRLPPCNLTYWPILGHISFVLDMLKNGSAVAHVNRARALNWRTSEVCVMSFPRDVSLMDPRDREYLLRGNWTNFVKNGGPNTGAFDENFAEILGRGIFAVDGEEWQDHRKVSSHMFSANGLRDKMEKAFSHHAITLVRLFTEKAASGVVIDFQDAMAGFTFEAISDIAFGVKPGALEAGITTGKKIPFLLRFDRLQQNCILRYILPPVIWKPMRFLNIGFERTIRDDASALKREVSDMIASRRNSPDFETSNDLLALYVRTGKSTGKKALTDDIYLMDVCLNFMVAGRDTTACTLTNMFKLLSQHPEVEKKMLAEFDEVVGRDNVVTWEVIRNLPYGGAVFNETIRMYPPVYKDGRTVLQDDVMPSGLRVEAGTRVAIYNDAIGRDPQLWLNPDSFLPERWLQNDKGTRRPDEYIFPVFWGGPRLCLGKDMARLETLAVAHAILSKFHIRVMPHCERPVNGPIQFYEEGLPAIVELRR